VYRPKYSTTDLYSKGFLAKNNPSLFPKLFLRFRYCWFALSFTIFSPKTLTKFYWEQEFTITCVFPTAHLYWFHQEQYNAGADANSIAVPTYKTAIIPFVFLLLYKGFELHVASKRIVNHFGWCNANELILSGR
jgi:hypothetical protein